MRRRTFLGTLLAAAGTRLHAGARREPGSSAVHRPPHVAVVGAGAFGGWIALSLQRRGIRVTLLDPWGPGNARSSSGGETRVIRHLYGDRLYVDMTRRALELWRESSRRWELPILRENGVLFMAQAAGADFIDTAVGHARAAGIPFDDLDPSELAHRFPQINPDGIVRAVLEPEAGFLLARRACQAVVDEFVAGGGDFRLADVRPEAISGGELSGVVTGTGTRITADAYVFACGPWLAQLFPDVLGDRLRITRQEVHFFGTPPGRPEFDDSQFPVWADFGERLFYGIPGNERRGFKIADDTLGAQMDPSSDDRSPSADAVDRARTYLARRFPGLGPRPPLLEARVCQYSNTPDADLLVDRHPAAENLWLVGGGSGHGFKLAPALGEQVAAEILGKGPGQPEFRLPRPFQA